MNDTNWGILERLETFCAARGRSMPELAFGRMLAQPVVVSVIAGANED